MYKQIGSIGHQNYVEKGEYKHSGYFVKLHRKKYVETTWIFRPSKLCRKKYVETTWIFSLAKLHRKSTWKWRGNSRKFCPWRMHVISMSNRRPFDVECPLGKLFHASYELLFIARLTSYFLHTSQQLLIIEWITNLFQLVTSKMLFWSVTLTHNLTRARNYKRIITSLV